MASQKRLLASVLTPQIILLQAFFLAAPALGFAAEAVPAATCGPRCPLVNVVIAKPRMFSSKVSLTGGIQPKFQSEIAFRINGKMTERLVEIGDHVTGDQVLARLDPHEQQANLDTAQATLASAQALLAQAKVTFERQDTLLKNGYTTRTSFDQAQQQLRSQQASVDSAIAALGDAREQFGYTDLKSDVAGIVTARNAEAGQVIQAGQTVFTIAQDGARDAVFEVYEALLIDPPAGDKVQIALQSDPLVRTTGNVREISPTVDSSSGTVRVKVGLDTVPGQMTLGAAVVASGEFKPRSAIVLPRSALFRWDNAPAVWKLDPKTSTVEPHTVTIGRFDGEDIILTSGVETGDSVVSAGIQFLYPGEIVETAQPDPHS